MEESPTRPKKMLSISYTSPKFTVHKFITEVIEKKLVFHVIKMVDSLLIYVNEKNQPYCEDLAFALKDRYSNSLHCTNLMNNIPDTTSNSIATRLSKKLNKPVFLSFNLQCDQDRIVIPSLEKRLFEEIQQHPECF